MTLLTFTKKADLIAALEARRSDFERIDKERMAKHVKNEKAYLDRFKKGCREALKWDYAAAKDAGFEIKDPASTKSRDTFSRYGTPSCPHSLVTRLDNLLTILNQSRQERYSVEPRGRWSDAWDLLLADQLESAEMC